ncbi:dihydroxyacetone kinase subunit DhaK [Swingsia samuiensis]|uniref:DAK2 domain-containing protein n=1 Tax=Swingsia samuiensis TaxID=1293412 RepID=A0A4Y6UN96_9PROT|nr:dihydroxyacetone kinase subunit DhaK [Swingsia samuiensis]QDH17866.1 DAK2 domain-containing protein [Swingsia samuiensis]
MKRFLNSRETLVTESLDGFLRSPAGKNLYRLDGYPDIRVILRSDWDKKTGKVAILSGGGSGHEPAHAGFVGEGMLTGAICGALFASPGIDAILSAILAVTGDAGCLLIIKNYTGDRLNFNLAAEQARGMGLKVETILIGDDIALGERKHARALAGTVFMHKVAGYLSEEGKDLKTISNSLKKASEKVYSIGLALSDSYAYEDNFKTRLDDKSAELGLGIHSEPGAETIPMATADKLMKKAADALESKLPSGKHNYALMLNNLGTVPIIEATLLLESFAKTSLSKQIRLVTGPAHFLTSLDMNGFSLSVIHLDKEIETALLAPAAPLAWNGFSSWKNITIKAAPKLPEVFIEPPSKNPELRKMIERGIAALKENENSLNLIDAKVGDGDAGSTFADTARILEQELDHLPLKEPKALIQTVGRLLSRHSGGSSGALLSILFSVAGNSEKKKWQDALMEGVGAMQEYGGASLGDRTMLDAIIPAITALKEGKSLSDATQAARAGADATAKMKKASAGRSSYVPESHLKNIPDPGAEAIALLCEAITSKGI